MHDDKAVSLAILMSNALGGPTADGIDDVGWAFDGTEAIAQTVSEGVAETIIAHQTGSLTERAYNRTDFLEQRRELMEAWGRYLRA